MEKGEPTEPEDGHEPDEPGGLAERWRALGPAGRRGIIAAAAIAVLLLIVIGFVLTRGDEEEPPPPPAPTTTTVAVTTTTEPEVGPIAPLTGLRLADLDAAERPAIAVKIDNLDSDGSRNTAVPQAGLAAADIVFEELVEGNITRFVAVFHSSDPGDRVGPVRSARTTDLHILPQFGRTLFAWSGGNAGVTAAVLEAESLIDLGHNRQPDAYTRDSSRRAPHNLYLDAGSLWGHAPDEVIPPDPIFEYRDDEDPTPSDAEAAAGVDLTWGGGPSSSPVGWAWDEDLELYHRTQRDRAHVDEDGNQIVAQNIVVLITDYIPSPADPRSPEAVTTGEGDALVFTDGVVIRGRWRRPALDRPALLVDEADDPILLTPGQTWIELPREGEVTVRSGAADRP